nr:glycoside hydrolase family 140 protein [Rhodocytophaga rosea]
MAQLKVSPNKRYLVKADGTPFFYLGDTAWELFHRLNREEADRYLQNRADKGFTVIQAVALAELDGLTDPNPYGHIPLKNNDPTQPNEDYFKHVDYIVNKAQSLGLYISMLPTWGDKIFKDKWGAGPEIFTTQSAKVYGQFLGKRYANKPIIWVLGGDRNPRDEKDIAIWRAMAEGIIAGAGGTDKTTMTYHPQPKEDGGSSTWFHNDEWLDFNMFQTGHCRNSNLYEKITHDYNLTPVKPTMDGEPIYEDHPVCFNAKDLGYSAAYDVRRAAYLDLFAGAFGHTYGCHAVWQMYAPNRKAVNGPLKPWFESIDLPGAEDMTHVRALMESRPILDRVPDQSLLTTDAYAEGDRIQATRGKDYLFVYTTTGRPFTLAMGKISGKQVKGFWFDPREGKSTPVEAVNNTGTHSFTPPSKGLGKDWILILDDASKNYKEPQKVVTRKI